MPKFLFGDIVVVKINLVGVIVKTWEDSNGFNYDVYVRCFNKVKNFQESEIERFRFRPKYLSAEELESQNT